MCFYGKGFAGGHRNKDLKTQRFTGDYASMPAGRPSKLTPKAIEDAERYIDGEYALLGHVIPTAAGLAEFLGVGKKTLYRWAEDQPSKFRHILDKLNTLQERELIGGGLSGVMNSAIVKLVLGKHGYHERQEHTGAEGKPIEHKVSNVTFQGPDE